MARKSLLTVMVFGILTSFWQSALAVNRSSRVVEVEDLLTDKALRLIQARFPNQPSLVSVQIQPLRREVSTNAGLGNANENLPFNIFGEVETIDEWDNPKIPIQSLLLRIRSALITVHVPHTVNDPELVELRNALFGSLGLVQGRDQVEFQRKQWEGSAALPLNLIMAGIAILIVASTMYFSARLLSKQVGQAVSKLGDKSKGSSAPMAAPIAPIRPNSQPTQAAKGSMSDVRFNDPLRIKQELKKITDVIEKLPHFPALNDMISLHQIAMEDLSLLGALIAELPRGLQDALFALSPARSWMQAFSEPGQLSIKTYEVLEKISRYDRSKLDPHWDAMLVMCWRLEDKMPDFLMRLDQEEAMTILATMPTEIAIPAARKAFPGAWAALLDSNKLSMHKLTATRMDEIKVLAGKALPVNELGLLEAYRHERSLLKYLRGVEVDEEREIYLASRRDAMIHKMRPPFFRVFELSTEHLKEMVMHFSIGEWAVALFNTRREDRNRLKGAMSEKQWFLLIETLKTLDRDKPEPDLFADVRERIAQHVAQIFQSDPSSEGSPEEMEHDAYQQSA
jgi:hypothetical protein